MIHGQIFNIQRFSTDDGDGIRTCVFLKGCPLRCAWCHNAESLSAAFELAFYAQNCIGCGACVEECPVGALDLQNGKLGINRTACKGCMRCAEVCCAEALVQIGKSMTVTDVMETVLKDRIFYGAHGGVTLTGGEPMLQPQFAIALAKAAKAEGLSVAMETSGFGDSADYEALLPYCDLFLFDCKASTERHRKLTGVEDTRILQNLDLLVTRGARIRLRCPIVEGANLDDAFVEKIVALAKRYPAIEAVQLMPYHNTGVEKAIHLGKQAQPIFTTPNPQTLAALAERIEQESGTPTVY